MKIGINIQNLQTASSLRGIGNYTVNLINELTENSEVEFYLLCSTFGNLETINKNILKKKNVKIIKLFKNVNYSLYNKLDTKNKKRFLSKIYQYEILSLNLEYFLETSFFEETTDDLYFDFVDIDIPTGVIVYDLIPLQDKKFLNNNAYKINKYHERLNQTKKFGNLFFISKNTRDKYFEIINENEFIKSDCIVIYGGVFNNNLKKNYVSEEKYIFSLISPEHHKNLDNLLLAYSFLEPKLRNQYKLYLCSNHLDLINFEKKLELYNIRNQVEVFENLKNEEVDNIFNNCSLYVQPSLLEGLSLPILYAEKNKINYICSNTQIFKEINASIKNKFNPYDPKSISNKISEFLVNRFDEFNFNEKKYSWPNASQIVINLIKDNILRKKINKKEQPNLKLVFFQLFHEELKGKNKLLKSLIYNSYPIIKSDKKKIYIEIADTLVHQRKTGIQRVTLSIVSYILKKQSEFSEFEFEFIYFNDLLGLFHSINPETLNKLLSNDNYVDVDKIKNNNIIDIEEGSKIFFLDLNPKLAKFFQEKPNFLDILKNKNCKLITFVHDLFPITRPDFFHESNYEIFNVLYTILFSNVDMIFCNSMSTKKNIENFIANNKLLTQNNLIIQSHHLGYNFGDSIKKKKDKKINQDKFILMVGTIEPRKDYEYAIKIFEEVEKEFKNLKLYIIGKKGWNDNYYKLITEKINNNKNIYLLDVNDQDLNYYYSKASLFLFTSHDEGYGIPITEAAYYELPIVSNNLDVVKEVFFNEIEYIDKINNKVDARKIINNLDNKKKYINMKKLCTWEEFSKKVLIDLLNI